MEEIEKLLNYIEENDLYPDIKMIEGVSTEPEILVDGKKVLMFCSNNYLGLANDKRIKEKMIE